MSAAPLPAALLDTPLTYEDMAGAGSGLGTASLIVVGEGTDMTAVAAGAPASWPSSRAASARRARPTA